MYETRRLALNQGKIVLSTRCGLGLSSWKFKAIDDDWMELGYKLSPIVAHDHMVYDEQSNGWTVTNNVYYLVDVEKKQIHRMIVLFCGTQFPKNFAKKVLLFSSNMTLRPAITLAENGYKELSLVSNDDGQNDKRECVAYAIDFSEDAISEVNIITLR